MAGSVPDLDRLFRQLDQCMLADQHRLRRRLRGLKRSARRRGSGVDARRLAEEITASIDLRRRRGADRPRRYSYPADLPVAARRQEIADAIAAHQVVVVCGETGSGKTTQLPKICLELGRGGAAMIGHTQPRRIAARSVAARIAGELGSSLGRHVGYKVRFTDRSGPACLLKIMTDGILLAETQRDRSLHAYDTIIIDEAHERSLNIDFLLGYLRRLQPKRPDLKIIITSATIDPRRFSEHFGGAPIVEVSGRTYPVEVRYEPLAGQDADAKDADRQHAILEAVDSVAALGRGDVLVFLAGEREIRETAEALRKHHPPQTEILPLYARLSTAEQDRVFQPHPGRRIVLATNVAETSLTVPGIRYVVDPGFARISRYSARRKVQLLPIEPISRASADQRKGRCGRISEGVCVRLYSQDDFDGRREFTDPEIVRSNLASVVLQMYALGLGEVDEFPFMDPPRRAMVRDGYKTLRELGALDPEHRLTDLGRRLARLPVDPRLGRMILAAEKETCLTEVLVIAAALSAQDPRERPMDRREQADAAHAQFQDEASDFLVFLNIWSAYHERKRHLSWNKLRTWCRENHLSFVRMREWVDIHQQLKRLTAESGMRTNDVPADFDAVHRSLLSGLLSSIGVRQEGYAYTGADGKTFHIFPGSGLFKKGPRWLMAAELVETTRLYARTVARIRSQWLEELAAHLVQRSHSDPRWHRESATAVANENVSLFGLPIVTNRRVPYGPVDPRASREIFIQHALVEQEYATDAPFFAHNRRLLEEIETLQAKCRSRDVLVDSSVRYAFYDQRVPQDVCSGRQLDTWRENAERENSRLLCMSRDDLMRHAADAVTAERYPDVLHLAGNDWKLEYRLEPGHPEDGITMTVAVEAVGQLDEQRLEWLVPGYLKEKVVALIKALPKTLRTNFVPAPDFAEACAEGMRFGVGPLVDAVSSQLEHMVPVTIPRDAWRPQELPPYLRMNVRVVDGTGRVVICSRDLDEIRTAVGAVARTALTTLEGSPFNRAGLTRWDFGDLPREVTVQKRGLSLRGHPAIVDGLTNVGLRLFDSPELAEQHHRQGLRRLYVLQMPNDINGFIRTLPGFDEMALLHAALGHDEELSDQLALLIADRAFLTAAPLPRTEAGFRDRLATGEQRIWEVGMEVCDRAARILEAHHDLAVALDRDVPPQWSDALADIRRHLGYLLPPGFFTATPYEWLSHFPRYLHAAERRLAKLARGGHVRDAGLADKLRPMWRAYLERAEEHRARGIVDPALEHYRWMLEELQVSMFAQELKTSVPVSIKRLARQWEQVRA
ncbi:MAG: ATP-dependent RNA helicase HrpA [Planctomycetota bacterium]|jgi:ATP-dependent helicase HrpA